MMQAALKQSTAIIAPDPFSSRRHEMRVPAGLTIAQVIAAAAANDNLPPRWSGHAIRAYVGGVEVPPAFWSRTRLKHGVHLAIMALPRGNGSKVLRTLLTVAVIALTAWVGGGALVGLLGSGFAAGTVGAALAAAGVSLVGGVIINALAPQPGTAGKSQAYSLQGAQNAPRPYEPLPVVLGRRRVVPPLAAATFTETVGDDVYLNMLLAWHLGPCAVSDIKIGETPISAYDGVTMQHRLLPGDAFPTLYDRIVREEPLQLQLTHAIGWVQHTTQRKTTTINMDFGWPTGLTKNGKTATVQLHVQYRATGAGAWTNAPVGTGGVITYSENNSGPFRRNIAWNVDEGQYDIQVSRVTADDDSTSVADDVYWVALRSLADGQPVLLDSLAITALRIKSSAQLNGVLDNINGVVQMHAPLWDSEAGEFSDLGATRNPGEIVNWLATGPANARPLTGRTLIQQLGEWTERCAEMGWHCDHVIDQGGTVEQAIRIAAGCGRGLGALWFDGLLAVAVDDVQDTPVQIFSARNVKNFQGTIAFPGALHAVNVNFSDEDNGFQPATRTVYADGYSAENATLFDTIDATGKTGAEEAYVVGWRYLAARTLRPEVYEFDTNMQGLCVRLGQRADAAHYRMSVGIAGARIAGVVVDEDDNVSGFLLDETVQMEDGKDYVFRVQSGSTIRLLDIVTDPGLTRQIALETPLAPEAAPRTGDHGIFGIADQETLPMIVIGIAVREGKDAHITALPYAPGLQADGGDIPDWDPLITPRVLHGAVVGTHVPKLEAVTNDNIIRAVNKPVDRDRLEDSVTALLDFVGADSRAKLDQIRKLSQAIAEVGLGASTDMQTIRRQLSSNFGTLTANYLEAITVATGPGSAIATDISNINVALAGKASTDVTDGLAASVTDIEGDITILSGQYSTINGQISDGTTGLSATYTIATGAAGQASTNAGNISTLTASYTNLAATIGGSYSPSSTVAAALAAQASDISANADSITDLNSSVGLFSASGLFRVSTAVTPGDAEARIALSVAATGGGTTKNAAIYIDALASGDSRVMLLADHVSILNGSDSAALSAAFEFVGGTLYVKNAVIPNLTADKITSGTLNVDDLTVTGTLNGQNIGAGEASKAYSYAQTSAMQTGSTNGDSVEIARITVRSLGGTINVSGLAHCNKGTGSGTYNNAEWRIYRTSVGGGTIVGGTLVESMPFYMDSGGEIVCPYFGVIAAGTYSYNTSFDVAIVVINAGTSKPVNVVNSKTIAVANR